MHFGGRRLRGTDCAVVTFGRGEISVTHHDLERFRRNSGIDQPLSTTPTEIVGAGKFLAFARSRILLDDDDAGGFANHRNNSAHSFLCKSVAETTRSTTLSWRRALTNSLSLIVGNRTYGSNRVVRSLEVGVL